MVNWSVIHNPKTLLVQCKMAAPIMHGADTNRSETKMSLKKAVSTVSPLTLRIIAECSVTKARACDLVLPHSTVSTPVFMPVGTQGTLKGITVDQLDGLGCQICLGNTYHLGMRPVGDTGMKIPVNLRVAIQCDLSSSAPVLYCQCVVFTALHIWGLSSHVSSSSSTTLLKGPWIDWTSQWFAWLHELEEKSPNSKCCVLLN